MVDIDIDELRRRLAAVEIADVAPLAGGASSLTFVVRVWRRCDQGSSTGVEPVAHATSAPGHIIKALAGTRVPVPE